jgi:hypothetical protein
MSNTSSDVAKLIPRGFTCLNRLYRFSDDCLHGLGGDGVFSRPVFSARFMVLLAMAIFP